jgi:hypothetical protein
LWIIKQSEKLSNAYWLKESFFRILDCKDRNNPKEQLSDWVIQLYRNFNRFRNRILHIFSYQKNEVA